MTMQITEETFERTLLRFQESSEIDLREISLAIFFLDKYYEF